MQKQGKGLRRKPPPAPSKLRGLICVRTAHGNVLLNANGWTVDPHSVSKRDGQVLYTPDKPERVCANYVCISRRATRDSGTVWLVGIHEPRTTVRSEEDANDGQVPNVHAERKPAIASFEELWPTLQIVGAS